MEKKKKLIGRLALGAGVVLALALVVAAGTSLAARSDREQQVRNVKLEREQLVERSRKYLGELARRVDRLPVDPTLVSEIESRYFEEYASGPMHVWAMGTDGAFLFGVPREAFEKLNAIYDQDVAPNLKEGVFVDRQTFLRTLVDSSDEIGPKSFAAGEREDDASAWNRWRSYGHDSERSFVVSAPLKTSAGAALGSLYLKRAVPAERGFRQDEGLRAASQAAGMIAALSAAFLWLLLPTWVYVDARGRGVRRAWLFAFLTAISALVGLIVYLIARPETPAQLQCPGCGREVDGGAYCPHCGHDLSTAFCATCRYPLKPDWAFCPACRTEIRPARPEPAAPAPEAAG
ncbi:MAG: zinc ribbon domain-containing protein [Betaproteobacteria bacterium]